MKRETREIKTEKTVYIAMDNTEFNSEDECRKYEESAECIINKKVNDCVKEIRIEKYNIIEKRTFLYALIDRYLDDDNCRCKYYLLKPTTEKELDSLIQWFYVKNFIQYNSANNQKKWDDETEENYLQRTKLRSTVAIDELEKNKNYILMINDECEFNCIVSLEKIKENITEIENQINSL